MATLALNSFRHLGQLLPTWLFIASGPTRDLPTDAQASQLILSVRTSSVYIDTLGYGRDRADSPRSARFRRDSSSPPLKRVARHPRFTWRATGMLNSHALLDTDRFFVAAHLGMTTRDRRSVSGRARPLEPQAGSRRVIDTGRALKAADLLPRAEPQTVTQSHSFPLAKPCLSCDNLFCECTCIGKR